MKIGEVARAADVSVDTVRYYERRGLIPTPGRTSSGYRIYDAATVNRIGRVRRLRQIGLTLDEIVDALRAHDAGGTTCGRERWRLDAVVDRIDAQIAELQGLRQSIDDARAECDRGRCEFATDPGIT